MMHTPKMLGVTLNAGMGFLILCGAFALAFTDVLSDASSRIRIEQPNRSILAVIFFLYGVFRLMRAYQQYKHGQRAEERKKWERKKH